MKEIYFCIDWPSFEIETFRRKCLRGELGTSVHTYSGTSEAIEWTKEENFGIIGEIADRLCEYLNKKQNG